MLRKLLSIAVVLCLTTSLLTACGQKADTAEVQQTQKDSTSEQNKDTGKEPVTIEVTSTQPEYLAQEQEIWSLYMEENPNVTIKVTTINEDQRNAHMARIAANEAPHIMATCFPYIDKSTYKSFANLLDIDFPYWDLLSFDAKKLPEQEYGIKDYVPSIQMFDTFNFSFIYYKDEMQKAGLDPSTIKNWDDVDKFLAELKKYVDKTEGLDYVLDTGWHSWAWMNCYMNIWSLSMGATPEDMHKLFMGETKFTDMEKNPTIPFFKKIKEYYDKGYLPKNWYARNWENEFEASFISKKSIFTVHGPWLWDKALAANPNAQLDGVTLPAGKDGKLAAYPVSSFQGSAILAQYVGTPIFEEVKKAFIWYLSPETSEKRAQFLGMKPNLKEMSSSFTLAHPQYKAVVKPAMEGKFGEGLSWDNSPWGHQVAGPFKVEGKPNVLEDDALATTLGKYLEGNMSLEDFMKIVQERWQTSYKFN